MPFRAALRFALPIAALAVAALTAGCGRHYVRYGHNHGYAEGEYAEEGREETVVVRVRHAQKRGKRVFVHTQLTNRSGNTIVVHRDELKLRLADGRELNGTRGRGKPIVIKPGQTKHVKVGFKAPRHTDLSQARLLMNGVRIAGTNVDSLGEVDLTKEVSTFVIGRASEAVQGDARGPAGFEEVEGGEGSESEDDAEDAEPASDEAEDDEPSRSEQPEEEGWQVGGS